MSVQSGSAKSIVIAPMVIKRADFIKILLSGMLFLSWSTRTAPGSVAALTSISASKRSASFLTNQVFERSIEFKCHAGLSASQLTTKRAWATKKHTILRQFTSGDGSNLSFFSDDVKFSSDAKTIRKELLRSKLAELGIDTDALESAHLKVVIDPTAGYDGRFGSSAIKTYRSFIHPKKRQEETFGDENMVRMSAIAARCAQQIDFLMRRHKSHQAEWVRHHDVSEEQRRQRQVFPLILLLDNLRSTANVGSLFRTADAAGVLQVLTTGITPHPSGSGSDKLQKSALGAETCVDTRHFLNTREAINYIRTEFPKYQIVGVETTAKSVSYTKHTYSSHGAVLVLGNEVTGVDIDLLEEEVDVIVEIPMFGAKNSLNVAACAPVVLYEVIRQWTAEN